MAIPVQLPNWSTKTILIAEDLDDNYAVLSALLKRTNIQLIRAVNGTEVLQILNNHPEIRFVLMDISMPDMDGIEVLHLIRKEFPTTIVIAQTAHSYSDQIAAEEFDAYLQKPIHRLELVNLLGKYLN